MSEEDTAMARLVEDSREAIKAIARQIRANPVTVEVEGGAVSATALANGQLTRVHISAAAQRGYDNQTLSELVTSAAQQAMRKAVQAEFDGLREATQGRASSLNDIFGAAIDEIADEIADEDRREQADADRWSFRYERRPAPAREAAQHDQPIRGRRPAPAQPAAPRPATTYDPLNPYGNRR